MQTVPHAPQFFESDPRLASHPFAGKPSQLLKPGEQTTTAQAPWTQATVDACASVQLAPQPLQFCGSNIVFVHRPAQFVSPEEHDNVHAPLEQTEPGAQAFVQLPQCVASLFVSLQTPVQLGGVASPCLQNPCTWLDNASV